MSTLKKVNQVTQKIVSRSITTRENYLKKIHQNQSTKPSRLKLSCGNLAHTMSACTSSEKASIAAEIAPNIGIISAYNDLLSAHKPYEKYPEIIRKTAQQNGATAQMAGGVPAMCDGITQGQSGMELSLFSRDVIAMSTAIALSHQVFDGILCLGICDKIVPGILMGALSFGHLPMTFIPAGPMKSGVSNKIKHNTRQKYVQGKITKKEMLEVESESYHSKGTCTFYGTANTNQMLMEIMGLQLPGSSFINPDSLLRNKLTRYAVTNQIQQLRSNNDLTPLSEIISVKTIVNGLVGLLATGGSTNLTIHLIAIAKAAGIIITWEDISELSKMVPLLCQIYPNGEADINQFQNAGGMGFLIKQLLSGGLLHRQVKTIIGEDLMEYTMTPELENNPTADLYRDSGNIDDSKQHIVWKQTITSSKAPQVLTDIEQPFQHEGGLKLLMGNIGKSIIKVSAVAPKHQKIKAKAKIFDNQDQLIDQFNQGLLNTDFIAVVRYQGPRANGMPELHKLMPIMGSLQDVGHQVAIITDGRMSGASGKVPSAIHMSPEAKNGGAIGRIQQDDLLELDAIKGTLNNLSNDMKCSENSDSTSILDEDIPDCGRELFTHFRSQISSAEEGASVFNF